MASAAVEQWRPLVQQFFAPQDVEKALYVIEHESGGNPNIYGDGGHAVGLFQHNDGGLASGRSLVALQDPEANIRLAAEAVYGGQGWKPWGENNLYQGQVFGALGNNPYSGGRFGAPAMPPNEPVDPALAAAFAQYASGGGDSAPSVRYDAAGLAYQWDGTAWVRAPMFDGSRTAGSADQNASYTVQNGILYQLDPLTKKIIGSQALGAAADPALNYSINNGVITGFDKNTGEIKYQTKIPGGSGGQNRLSSSALGRVDPLKGKETNRAAAPLFEKGPFSAYADENYGSASTPGGLAYDIKNQGPAAAFKFGAPEVGFEVAGQDAVLGPFGGVGSGGVSGDIQVTGAQTATIGGGGDYNAQGVFEPDTAGYGYESWQTLQAYGADITGDPLIDNANAANLTAQRDNLLLQGKSPAQAQQIIMMGEDPYVPNPYEAQAMGQVSGKGTTGVPVGGISLPPGGLGQTFARGGNMTTNDPIAMINMRNKKLEGVFGEAGPERATFTPMGRRPPPVARDPFVRPARPAYAQSILDWTGTRPMGTDPLAWRAWAQSRPMQPRATLADLRARAAGAPPGTLPAGIPGFATGGTLTSDATGVQVAPPVAPVSYNQYMSALAPTTQMEYLDARNQFRTLNNQTNNLALPAASVSIPYDARVRNAATAAIDPQMRNQVPVPAPVPAPAPAPVTPGVPGAEVADAVRLAYEARQRAMDAYKYSAAGLPQPTPVDLPLGAAPELPPGLYNRQPDISGAIIELQNQLLGATDPEVRKRIQEAIDQLQGYVGGGGDTQGPPSGASHPVSEPVGGVPYSTTTPDAIQSWMATRPTSGDVNAWRTWMAAMPGGARIPRIGDTVEPLDPLALLAARKFGDKAA